MWMRLVISRSFSSKFKPSNKLFVKGDIMSMLHSSDLIVSEIKWDNVRHELLTKERSVNAANLDGIIVGICSKGNRLDLARSYLDFMKSQSQVINDAAIGRMIRLYYRHYLFNNIDKISSEDEEDILQLSKSLLNKYELLEATLAENVIYGLSITRDWMKCFELLNHICVTSKVNTTVYDSLISRAFTEDKLDIAFDLLHEMVNNQLAPKSSVFLKFFKRDRSLEETEKMMNFISDSRLMLSEDIIEDFRKIFNKNELPCNATRISRNGNCSSCSQVLPSAQLNDKEFAKLSKNFLSDVMVRRDVFLKSNPDEMKRFVKFVEKSLPFDCVIDGLNAAFSHGPNQTIQLMAKNVAAAVKYFVDKRKTCLVVGRKHMAKWPKNTMEFIRSNSSLFLAEDLSEDDPFLLYAALRSGPNTSVFSRDLMRDHSFLLDADSKKLFRKWQQQNQHLLITTLQGGIVVKEPIAYELKAHKVGSCWHVPFTNSNHRFTHETFEHPTSWLCINFETFADALKCH